MSERLLVERPPPAPEELPASPEAFLEALGGPALLRVPGRDRSRTRALSTLLHGNEPSGLRALHAWLARGRVPAVDLLVFVASVTAALAEPRFSHRALPGRVDLNRCFLQPPESTEGRLAAEALAALGAAAPEALVDLHNTTGHTPSYAVCPDLAEPTLQLASLFTRRYVHSDLRMGTLVEATHQAFPALVIECGRAGDAEADRAALRGLEAYAGLDALPRSGVPEGFDVLARPVRVFVREGLTVAYGARPAAGADLTVREDIDRHSFERLPAGATVGWVHDPGVWPVYARGAEPRDLSAELFALEGTELRARRDQVPIMITTDPTIALSDCLFYALERVRER